MTRANYNAIHPEITMQENRAKKSTYENVRLKSEAGTVPLKSFQHRSTYLRIRITLAIITLTLVRKRRDQSTHTHKNTQTHTQTHAHAHTHTHTRPHNSNCSVYGAKIVKNHAKTAAEPADSSAHTADTLPVLTQPSLSSITEASVRASACKSRKRHSRDTPRVANNTTRQPARQPSPPRLQCENTITSCLRGAPQSRPHYYGILPDHRRSQVPFPPPATASSSVERTSHTRHLRHGVTLTVCCHATTVRHCDCDMHDHRTRVALVHNTDCRRSPPSPPTTHAQRSTTLPLRRCGNARVHTTHRDAQTRAIDR
jgi:hypothetical protein